MQRSLLPGRQRLEVIYAPAVSVNFPVGALWLSALVFLVTGLAFTVAPESMFAAVGLDVPSGAPLTELRAVYGGLEVGVGIFLALCARRGGVAVELGLVLSFLMLGSLATYRGIGMGIDSPQAPLMSVLLVLEAAGAVLAVAALLVLGRASTPG